MQFAFAVLFCAAATQAAQFQIVNNLTGPIWVGIMGGGGKAELENGGFELGQNQQRSVSSDDSWQGRFWARTWCDPNSKHCETGDCGNRLECQGSGGAPTVTLVEILLRGDGGLDFYDISLVDGFNVPATIEPINGRGDCKRRGCNVDLNENCPSDLEFKGAQVDYAIACLSSCTKFNTDRYCCSGAYSDPESCDPNNWEVNSAKYFKDNCPDAYSYAYDDTSLSTCMSQAYKITFG